MLDTSNYSILWTVPNNPYDVMGAWVPHVGDGQWLSGIQHILPISLGVGNLITFSCNIGRMLDFEDDEFDEPSAMVQINTPNPKDLKAYPEQRTILRMRYFKIHPKFQTSIVSIRRGDHIICRGDHTIHRGDHIIRRGDHYDGTNYLRCLLVSEQATVQSSSVGQKQVNPPLLFLIFLPPAGARSHTWGHFHPGIPLQ